MSALELFLRRVCQLVRQWVPFVREWLLPFAALVNVVRFVLWVIHKIGDLS